MQRAMKAVHMKPFCTLPPSVCMCACVCARALVYAQVCLYVTGTTNRFEEAGEEDGDAHNERNKKENKSKQKRLVRGNKQGRTDREDKT